LWALLAGTLVGCKSVDDNSSVQQKTRVESQESFEPRIKSGLYDSVDIELVENIGKNPHVDNSIKSQIDISYSKELNRSFVSNPSEFASTKILEGLAHSYIEVFDTIDTIEDLDAYYEYLFKSKRDECFVQAALVSSDLITTDRYLGCTSIVRAGTPYLDNFGHYVFLRLLIIMCESHSCSNQVKTVLIQAWEKSRFNEIRREHSEVYSELSEQNILDCVLSSPICHATAEKEFLYSRGVLTESFINSYLKENAIDFIHENITNAKLCENSGPLRINGNPTSFPERLTIENDFVSDVYNKECED